MARMGDRGIFGNLTRVVTEKFQGRYFPVRLQAMTAAPQLSLSGQVASQAEFIVNNFQQTDYQHKDRIDVDAGIYDCDCNGFVGFVLERAAPGHFAKIPKETTQPRPRAFKYYEFFASATLEGTGWRRVDSLADARRGDIIAWRFPDIEVGHNTGHVLFVADTPRLDASGNFAVRVYDSAAVAHFEDTRAGANGNGVGSGFVNFMVDSAGAPTKFQFGPTVDHWDAFPIAIGRVEPLP